MTQKKDKKLYRAICWEHELYILASSLEEALKMATEEARDNYYQLSDDENTKDPIVDIKLIDESPLY